jgi:hypothetical protein
MASLLRRNLGGERVLRAIGIFIGCYEPRTTPRQGRKERGTEGQKRTLDHCVLQFGHTVERDRAGNEKGP